ncbi:hypothetical protein I552_3282 [Mycobacterium xenopi 3993]|nr:hypothetical protein I552_3282 [Mycobacterium xenopi 3993]
MFGQRGDGAGFDPWKIPALARISSTLPFSSCQSDWRRFIARLRLAPSPARIVARLANL